MSPLFPSFRSQQIKPVWEFQAEAHIWRILFAPQNTIIGETRDQGTKSAKYFCLHAETGSVLWKEMLYDEPWWIGVEAVHECGILLHGFARPDMPEHKGIRVIDHRTGALRWKNDDVCFWFIHEQKIYAYTYLFEKRIAYELDFATGEVLQEYTGNLDPLHEVRRKIQNETTDMYAGIIYPELLYELDPGPVIAAAVRNIVNTGALENSIEILEHEDILITSSYHSQKEEGNTLLRNMMAVYSLKKKKILFSETLAENIQTPSRNTFFVKNSFLYFIKNTACLTAVQPWKS